MLFFDGELTSYDVFVLPGLIYLVEGILDLELYLLSFTELRHLRLI